jgi:branched-chain amino acid transport system ATP-binding protein
MSPEPLCEVDDLVTGYGRSKILHGLSPAVGCDEAVGLIGPNGAGKPSLLKTSPAT